jgi:hypothetical protein
MTKNRINFSSRAATAAQPRQPVETLAKRRGGHDNSNRRWKAPRRALCPGLFNGWSMLIPLAYLVPKLVPRLGFCTTSGKSGPVTLLWRDKCVFYPS